jgi:hypothetical protein
MRGSRIDYYNDPSAPAANSLAPSVNVIAANDAGEILLAPSRAPALRDADT